MELDIEAVRDAAWKGGVADMAEAKTPLTAAHVGRLLAVAGPGQEDAAIAVVGH